MPLPLIMIILSSAAALTVIVLLIIYYDDIVKWFRERNDIKEADKDNIAFTIKQNLESGNYKVIQGIFNKRTNKLEEGKAMEAEQIDEKLAEAHVEKELVLYE